MRHDFRVKMDFSQIYQDVRQFSWIYIDSMKILYVQQLAIHVRKLFNIEKPFHFMSKFEGTYLFLPFEEDIRVLENNDTVIIVPGTGISNDCEMKKKESSCELQSGFSEPKKPKEKQINPSSEISCTSYTSSIKTSVKNIIDTMSLSGNLYTTAMHETAIYDNRDIKTTDDNFTEDNSSTQNNIVLSKPKRVRKRRHKKLSEMVSESDTSIMEVSSNKPKIIDSILISTGKHIRFKGLEDEDSTLDIVNENNIQEKKPNNGIINHQFKSESLNSLLNLGRSSTPLTFGYRKMKKEFRSQTIDEHSKILESSKNLNSQLNESAIVNDTISFKVLKMGDDYTPQLSSDVVAKVLSYSPKDSQYILKILHGKEQLEEPEGKFSLPKSEENSKDETNDIFTFEKSKLLELRKVSTMKNDLLP